MVFAVGDVDVVFVVHGNSVGDFKLERLLAFGSPGGEEFSFRAKLGDPGIFVAI